MKARFLFVFVAVAWFLLDRYTKLRVVSELKLYERHEVWGDVFAIHSTRNYGIAFSLFANAGSLVVIGTLIVGALLFYFMTRVDPNDLLMVLGGSLITAGALGNLVDRVKDGYVVDFLQFPRFPTFNVADVGITVGVALVLLSQYLTMRRETREEAA
ncbi:MAG: signal peptidase II [Thermoleophilia bacterium]|nr:signal peptidase II [Thermoleophilia bacterium]